MAVTLGEVVVKIRGEQDLLKRDINAADDPAALEEKKIADYREKFANPYIAAERGYIDDVIMPSETRRKLVEAFALLETKRDRNPPKKHGNLPL